MTTSTRKAVIVGIDNYPKASLHGCCNDADAMASVLSRHEDGSINFHVQKHTDDNAVKTKGGLRSLIGECFSGNEEVALFYYSGHGHIDSFGGYLVTPDYSPNDVGVSLQDVLTTANDSHCRDRIIILDSCYSGFMGDIKTLGQKTAVINEGVTILTSSSREQTAITTGKHGLFTSLLLEALNGGAADTLGNITVGSIYSFIDKSLTPWDQRPIFKTNVTHFTSLRNVKPQVDLSTIKTTVRYFGDADSVLALDPSFEDTNDPDVKHELIKPYAYPDNVKKLKNLQKLVQIGLVVPVGAEHMYFAAMKSKSCKLTAVGKHYWKLDKEGKI